MAKKKVTKKITKRQTKGRTKKTSSAYIKKNFGDVIKKSATE